REALIPPREVMGFAAEPAAGVCRSSGDRTPSLLFLAAFLLLARCKRHSRLQVPRGSNRKRSSRNHRSNIQASYESPRSKGFWRSRKSGEGNWAPAKHERKL